MKYYRCKETEKIFEITDDYRKWRVVKGHTYSYDGQWQDDNPTFLQAALRRNDLEEMTDKDDLFLELI